MQTYDNSFLYVGSAIFLYVGSAIFLVAVLAVLLMLRSNKAREIVRDPIPPNGDASNPADDPEHSEPPDRALRATAEPQPRQDTPPPEAPLVMELETVLPSDAAVSTLASALQALNQTEKHRIIYRFIPNMRGILLDGEALDGYLADAAERAGRKGWSELELASAATSGQWKRRRPVQTHQPDSADD